jgi:hypothetical protein
MDPGMPAHHSISRFFIETANALGARMPVSLITHHYRRFGGRRN